LENHGRVSPDGRWLAFSTTDANETRVYVTTFPEPTELWLVSAAGGSDPQWRADGHELYYIAPDDTLVAVAVETYPEFAISARTTLFDVRFDPQSRAYGSAYASTPDGERFIVAELAEHTEPQLVVTHNWTKVVTRP
jgi:dipeptidyl aminopeptidase/acylaminoacyl peptidase